MLLIYGHDEIYYHVKGSTIPSGTLLNPLPRGPRRCIQLIPRRTEVIVWITRVQTLSDEPSRFFPIASNALIWDGNCEMTKMMETGIQIMSQRPIKIHGPHDDDCEAGCNDMQMAGSTQITR